MRFNRENAFCCGGGGGLKSNFPQLSLEISKERVKQAEEVGANVLITSCPLCYLCLKEASKNIKVIEFSQLFKI